MPGTTVQPRYQVIEQIGGGAWSTVYRVLDLARGSHEIALKLLCAGAPPRATESLRSEFRFLSSCCHPNLVPVYDFGLSPSPFFTMELQSGQDPRAHALPQSEAIQVLLSTLDALEFIHRRGMVHLDVRPNTFGSAPTV